MQQLILIELIRLETLVIACTYTWNVSCDYHMLSIAEREGGKLISSWIRVLSYTWNICT